MGKKQDNEQDLSEVKHWADRYAEKIIAERGEKEQYVCASGVTPSGTVHLGNFREVITTELVVRALQDKGKKVRYIYSWDDYDRFRKVPKNISKDFEGYIGKPVSALPDPFGCHESYAEHFEGDFESQARKVGISSEYIRQSVMYSTCKYAESIRFALNNRQKIREILNEHKSKDLLPEDWIPLSVYCEKCGKDDTKIISYDEEYSIEYSCKCGHKDRIDFRKKGLVKLPWRIDWPMRWDYEKVDFESGGKDHYASGGTRETGEKIYQSVWNKTLMGFPYEFVGFKGLGQFASSEGIVLTIDGALQIYEPEMLRWFFASTRPNAEFMFSFDLDVIKNYEDFDRMERIYFDAEETDEKNSQKQKRIYQLSMIKDTPKKLPFQPGFRHITTLIQTYEDDQDKVIEYLKKDIKDDYDMERLKSRIIKAQNWLKDYAPEDFKFSIQAEKPEDLVLSAKQNDAIAETIRVLESKEDFTEEELVSSLFDVPKKTGLDGKEFFGIMYKILINKQRGPKLAPFIITIGKERVIRLLKNTIG